MRATCTNIAAARTATAGHLPGGAKLRELALGAALIAFGSASSSMAAADPATPPAAVAPAPTADTAALAAAIGSRLAQPAVLRGRFEQTKQVAGFSRPLRSSGDFLVARDHGVLWHTREPFAGELRLTREAIVATQDGETAFRLSADEEPTVRVINGLMFSLLNGEVDRLAEHFTVDGQAGDAGWELALKPRQPGLAKLLSGVNLQGDRHVRRIVLEEANGDRTEIVFSDQRDTPPALTAEETARFE
ncbi:MAG: hypothetical protein DI564_08890 [Rhodanobacter denitrificans]|uniref:Outer membrane lipoprotein carrier protein LolA n=1 Tax=Rhodanobacter denitrificans TaxID=666685 RepID=A0A2W5KEE8_9GAMM|nr:MAG: hypothetical protein DI564_08890 [Rhodanobacter denitrificans]